MHNSKFKILFLIIALLAFALGAAFFFSAPESNEGNGDEVACTLEAKLCPDGSYVGRTGPNCEFAACPEVNETEGWETATDPESGSQFMFPRSLSATYIEAQDWPPQLNIVEEAFNCTDAGEATDRAGGTEGRTVNGRTYCVTEITEGAAGSIYTQYAYAFPYENATAILTFSTRMLQCGNYPDPQKSDCEAEQESFSIDEVVDQIRETIENT